MLGCYHLWFFYFQVEKNIEKKHVQQLKFHSGLEFILISRDLNMATYFRQLYYLLYKNAIFKLRHKRQAIIEVVAILYFVAVLVIIRKTAPQPTYDAIPSSEQIIYNASKIPGGKRQHLAYVTNINSSEFQFFSLVLLFIYTYLTQTLTQWHQIWPQFRNKLHPY